MQHKLRSIFPLFLNYPHKSHALTAKKRTHPVKIG